MKGLPEFVEGFVLPLLVGGPVTVRGPIRPREHRAMLEESGELGDARLRLSRLRRAMLVVAEPDLPDPDLDDLALWIGLHNTLAFDHPERARVWARSSTWRRAEGMTRGLLSQGAPTDHGHALARHVSVAAFLDLERMDVVFSDAVGPELRLRGQPDPRRGVVTAAERARGRPVKVTWVDEPHEIDTQRLLSDVLWASPLTCLLRPAVAPAGWSPLSAVAFLRDRLHARAIVNSWASGVDWIATGGRVMQGLLGSLGGEGAGASPGPEESGALAALPGAVLPVDPQSVGAVVGALAHLHLLKVLEMNARLGVALGSRDPAILSFLALPLLVARLEDTLGSPLAGLGTSSSFESQTVLRWTEYVDHLEELVSREIVDNLVATLVPRIVQTT